jgi:hypothetical protein
MEDVLMFSRHDAVIHEKAATGGDGAGDRGAGIGAVGVVSLRENKICWREILRKEARQTTSSSLQVESCLQLAAYVKISPRLVVLSLGQFS